MGFGVILLLVAFILSCLCKRRLSLFVLGAVCIWFLSWSLPLTTCIIGHNLEKDFYVQNQTIESFPSADAIVVLGGGVSGQTNCFAKPLLHSSADRAYYAMLLWKLKKAPIIICSNVEVCNSDAVFLADCSVPSNMIVCENEARNTEENAKKIWRLFDEGRVKTSSADRPKILLVTSAWHMKRSLLLFKKYAPGIECVPVPCDFGGIVIRPIRLQSFIPSAEVFAANSCFLHEWIGIWWYTLFRR